MNLTRNRLAFAAILIAGVLSTPLRAEDQKIAAAGPEKQDAGRANPKLDAQNYKAYIVRPGDSLWTVAQANGVDFTDLMRLNRPHLRHPARIAPGDKIYMPDQKQAGEGARLQLVADSTDTPAASSPAESKPDAADAQSAAKSDDTFSAAQKAAIKKVIREYLIQEPEVLREAIAELNKRQEVAAEAERKKVLASIYKEKSPYSTGDGKITLVEFFDYNCPYCRHALDNVIRFTKEEKDVRVVFVEFPILSEDSRTASQAAIAAAKQGKYFEFHRALMQHQGAVKEDIIYKVAEEVGLDVKKLKEDMKAPEVKDLIEKNLQLGTSMGVQGTPAFFIGDEAIPGAPEELRSLLKTAVASIRKKGCSIC